MPTVKKIELGATVAGIGLAIAVMLHLISYGRGEGTQNADLLQLRKDVDKSTLNSDKIPVIEADVKYLKQTADEIKQILLNRK